MNKETLVALKGSIRKWERIVAGKGIDLGTENCPLCKLFYKKGCIGCPVKEETGFNWCFLTPYDEWLLHHELEHGKPVILKVKCDTCKKLAERELKFLKSLLPKMEREKK